MSSAGKFAVEYQTAIERLVSALRRYDQPVLATLGPAGTSSDYAAVQLQRQLQQDGAQVRFDVRLHRTFEAVLASLVAGSAPFALVPSAFRNATAFHWHPKLRLLFHFVQQTPTYGLVRRPDGKVSTQAELRVASMHEVRVLYEEVCPAQLRGRTIEWVDAESTVNAAQRLVDGEAELALTNENARKQHNLEWVSLRPGADIVWLVFESTVAAAPVSYELQGTR